MNEALIPGSRQKSQFLSLEEEVFLNLGRTANRLAGKITDVLGPFGLTNIQYNVLRILRDSSRGLACSEIGERLVTKDSDITRLLARLEKRGLISRKRYEKDGRVIIVKITEAGSEILRGLDGEVNAALRRHLGHLGNEMLEKLNAMLILIKK